MSGIVNYVQELYNRNGSFIYETCKNQFSISKLLNFHRSTYERLVSHWRICALRNDNCDLSFLLQLRWAQIHEKQKTLFTKKNSYRLQFHSSPAQYIFSQRRLNGRLALRVRLLVSACRLLE